MSRDFDAQDGGLAFPSDEAYGMTVRDYFAAQAVGAVIRSAHLGSLKIEDWSHLYQQFARHAYRIADVMLQVRKESQP